MQKRLCDWLRGVGQRKSSLWASYICQESRYTNSSEKARNECIRKNKTKGNLSVRGEQRICKTMRCLNWEQTPLFKRAA